MISKRNHISLTLTDKFYFRIDIGIFICLANLKLFLLFKKTCIIPSVFDNKQKPVIQIFAITSSDYRNSTVLNKKNYLFRIVPSISKIKADVLLCWRFSHLFSSWLIIFNKAAFLLHNDVSSMMYVQ